MQVHGATPQGVVERARARIHAALAADHSVGNIPTYQAQTFCPDVVHREELAALFRTETLCAVLARLFGTDIRPRGPVQIALRFPESRTTAEPPSFHLDGFPTDLNAISSHRLHRPTAILGVFLTRLEGPGRGNLAVWPGSHLRFAARCRERADQGRLQSDTPHQLWQQLSQTSLEPPTELTVEPGDAVIMHHLMGHGTASNLALQTREAVYLRYYHRGDDPTDVTPLANPALHFSPGLPWPG